MNAQAKSVRSLPMRILVALLIFTLPLYGVAYALSGMRGPAHYHAALTEAKMARLALLSEMAEREHAREEARVEAPTEERVDAHVHAHSTAQHHHHGAAESADVVLVEDPTEHHREQAAQDNGKRYAVFACDEELLPAPRLAPRKVAAFKLHAPDARKPPPAFLGRLERPPKAATRHA